MKRIAVWLTDPVVTEWNFGPRHAERLERAFPETRVTVCRSKDKFLAALAEADTVFVWRFKEEWLESAPRLRRIATPAAGRDCSRLPDAEGITRIFGSFHGRIMAETAAGLVLAHARRLFIDMKREDEPWPRKAYSGRLRLVRGSRAVILGFGHIGEAIGRRLHEFGARVTGVRRHLRETPSWFGDGDVLLGADRLDEALPDADHLILALPGDSGTDDIIDARRLGLLPPRAALYNFGRGNAVDEAALADALATGRLAAAYLDVFKTEPLPVDSPLRRLPNCRLYPHVSAVTPEYLDFFLDEVIERLKEMGKEDFAQGRRGAENSGGKGK